MSPRRLRIAAAAAVTVAVFACVGLGPSEARSGRHPATYEIIQLTLGPTAETAATVFSQATRIAENGGVAGASTGPTHGSTHAFVFDGRDTTDLGTLGGDTSIAYDLDESGTLVGTARTPSGALVAVEWEDGVARSLGTLGGPESTATAIADDGTIAGWSATAAHAVHAFVRPPGGRMTDLGTLGGTTSIAYAVDVNRTVVGGSTRPGGDTLYAVVWRDNTIAELSTPPGTTSSVAYDIDSRGTVVGAASFADGSSRALVWNAGVPTELSTPAGASSVARGSNDRGWVVGELVSADGTRTPVAWIEGLRMELASLVPHSRWVLEEAVDVNNRGAIVGTGRYRGTSAFLLRPRRQDDPDAGSVAEARLPR